MKCKRLFFLILFLPIMVIASLEIETFQLFDGDKYGDFRNNIVVCLSDGSRWKVHPDDMVNLSEWKIGASISLFPRSSSYWLKREHKFRLYNADIDESVKAMIISYEAPLAITNVFQYSYVDYKLDLVPGWGLSLCCLLFKDVFNSS